MIKNYIKDFVKFVLYLLNNIIPKKSNRIIFTSTPDISDNSYYMYKYISKLNMDYELIWLVSKKESLQLTSKKRVDRIIYKKSFKGIWTFMRSKYYFGTHLDCFDFKCNKQIWIEFGHGTPFKSFIFSEKRFSNYQKSRLLKKTKNIDYYTTASNFVSNLISANVKVDIEKMIPVGYPRNDIMKNKKADELLLKIIDNRVLNKTKIIICPTFRIWEDINRKEGKSRKNIFGYEDLSFKELDEILEKNNCVLLLKLHPFEEKYYIDNNIKLPNNCYLITNQLLNNNNISLYDILPSTDALITDYSSVYFDYMLLNKPIIFNIYDIDKYYHDRGFILTPPEKFMPGPKVYDKNQLINELINVCHHEDKYKKVRNYMNDIFNENYNFNACEKVLKLLK